MPGGRYSVAVTDSNGCRESEEVEITEPTQVELGGETSVPITCYGHNDAVVNLTGLGGAAPYRYSANGTSWTSSGRVNSLSWGSKTFFIQDANGCKANFTTNLANVDEIEIEFGEVTSATCNDPVGLVSASISGGSGGYELFWMTNEKREFISADNAVNGLKSGIYILQAMDAKNCVVEDKIAIGSIGGVEFDFESIKDVTCFGDTNGSAQAKILSGEGPFDFKWSDGQTTSLAKDLAGGKYFLTVTDRFGCENTAQAVVASPEELEVSGSVKSPLCFSDCNGEITPTVKGGTYPYMMHWVELNSTQAVVKELCSGIYSFEVTDENGCIAKQSFELEQPKELTLTGTANATTCAGRCNGAIQTVVEGGTDLYQIEWSTGETTRWQTNLCPGEYSVSVSDTNGCTVAQSFSILEGPTLSIALGEAATLCTGQKLTLALEPGWSSAQWTSSGSFRSSQNEVVITEAGVYTVKATSSLGCFGEGTFKLTTSTDILQSEFIMLPELDLGDTLVAIDVSWPMPDSIIWSYPSSISRLPSPSDDLIFLKPTQEGEFQIGMRSFLAECKDYADKTLMVRISGELGPSSGRLGYEELIREFTLSPNPNNGFFFSDVLLTEPREIELQVVQFPTGVVKAKYRSREQRSRHRVQFDLPDLPAGIYLVLLSTGNEKRMTRFVKN